MTPNKIPQENWTKLDNTIEPTINKIPQASGSNPSQTKSYRTSEEIEREIYICMFSGLLTLTSLNLTLLINNPIKYFTGGVCLVSFFIWAYYFMI
jgi:hypothetical protein